MNLWTFVLSFILGILVTLTIFVAILYSHAKRTYQNQDTPLCPRCAMRIKENPEVQKAIIMTYFIKSGLKTFNCPGCGVELKLMYRKVDGR